MGDRLYRSRTDRRLAGVAGGLAEMWGADPALIRILWALLVIFTGGLAFVVYIIMAIVVPEGDLEPWPPAGDPGGTAGASVDGAPGIKGSGWTTPPGPAVWPRPRPRGDGNSSVGLILGAFLILMGGFFLAREYLPQLDFSWFWPAILIALGVLILISAVRRDGGGSSGAS